MGIDRGHGQHGPAVDHESGVVAGGDESSFEGCGAIDWGVKRTRSEANEE